MEASVFFAKLLGPYCIIVGIGVLFNLKTYQKVMEDFSRNTALVYLGGVMALFFGLLVVLLHNVWTANWAVIITVFGWLGIIKGAWLIILPNKVGQLAEAYRKRDFLLKVHLAVVIGIGVYLTLMGYFIA